MLLGGRPALLYHSKARKHKGKQVRLLGRVSIWGHGVNQPAMVCVYLSVKGAGDRI